MGKPPVDICGSSILPDSILSVYNEVTAHFAPVVATEKSVLNKEKEKYCSIEKRNEKTDMSDEPFSTALKIGKKSRGKDVDSGRRVL